MRKAADRAACSRQSSASSLAELGACREGNGVIPEDRLWKLWICCLFSQNHFSRRVELSIPASSGF
jgi:hypothetical protein